MASTRPSRIDLGLLALRVGVGATLFSHGAQKLFGWYGGKGLDATATAMDHMGFRPGKASALAAGLGETAGALIALGAATPMVSGAAAGTMIGAAEVHRPGGFFATAGGYEYPAVLGMAAGALAITGPGALSVDALLGNRLNRGWQATVALTAACAAGSYVVSRRRAAIAADAAAAEASTG
ncbi:MAG: DoxX family protein [Ilumatobacter sp.]|nr:DoxX family protein [Ilumatobacter sp.]